MTCNINLKELHNDGLTICHEAFERDELLILNEVASKLPAFVGLPIDKPWMNSQAVEQHVGDIDWAYQWARTPDDNVFINDTILPTLTDVVNTVFDGSDWGWQDTNRYIMSNYKHDNDCSPHLDAPYLWPQAPGVQMRKYLPKGILSITFMIPLVDFTVENGATAYVPGTHKFVYDTSNWQELKPHLCTFFKDNYVQPAAPLGSFLCFYGSCLHSVMSNTTNEVRRGIIYRAIRQDALDEMNRMGLG